MKRRIIRADSLNWAIQEWQEGGDEISRGRFAGQTKKAKWKMPESFFRTLADAARNMLHEEIGDVPNGTPITGKDILERIEVAAFNTQIYLGRLLEKQKDDVLIGILQERGYTVTDGKKGRKTLADGEPPPADDESTES